MEINSSAIPDEYLAGSVSGLYRNEVHGIELNNRHNLPKGFDTPLNFPSRPDTRKALGYVIFNKPA
jgi:hypothetical protein